MLVDLGEFASALLQANPWYLAAGAGLLYLDRGLMAYKWNLLLATLKVRVPFLVVFRAYMAAPLFQIALPSTIGTDLFRLYILSRFKADTRAVFASMILERIIGLAAILLLVLISFGLAFYVLRDQWQQLLGLGWGVVALALVLTATIGAAALGMVALLQWLPERLGRGFILRNLSRIYALSVEYRNNPGVVYRVFAWTFLEQLLPIAVLYLMAFAIHVETSLLELAVVVPLTTLALRLPISLDGLGVQEGMYLILFGAIGVSAPEALVLSVLMRVLLLLCAFPCGMYHIYRGGHLSMRNQPEQTHAQTWA